MDDNQSIAEQILDQSESLEHYGIKGQKWGVRRTKAQLQRARVRDVNTDKTRMVIINNKTKKYTDEAPEATRKHELRGRAREFGTGALTNKELQDVVTRMNLEQSYSRLNPAPEGKMAKGMKFAKKQLLGDASKTFKTGGDYSNAPTFLLGAAVLKKAGFNVPPPRKSKNKNKDKDKDN